ncbi:MAG TPA: hypothetical protein VGD68_11760, partial [Streptosporangiaceae bacterium]
AAAEVAVAGGATGAVPYGSGPGRTRARAPPAGTAAPSPCPAAGGRAGGRVAGGGPDWCWPGWCWPGWC